MTDSKTAKQILNMLDDKKRRAFQTKLWIVIAIVIVAFIASNRWESPLAVMPRASSAFALGFLYLYMKSISVYPKIAKYFDIKVLEKDANPVDSTK